MRIYGASRGSGHAAVISADVKLGIHILTSYIIMTYTKAALMQLEPVILMTQCSGNSL